jgi:hypothetical protein
MQYAGEQTYARSKAAAADPKYRQAADRAMRERELGDSAAKNEKRIADLESKLEEREKVAAADRALDEYFGRVTRRAGDETPHVKALIAKNPARARAELEEVAFELAKKLGRLPKAATVLAAQEKRIARMLRDYGVGAPAGEQGKKPEAGKPAGKKPDKGKAAKSTAGAKPAERTDRKPNGEIHHPSRDELLAELRDAT